MTETTVSLTPLMLTPLMEQYVVHWGEMGTRWGVNRTVAQIHALLYLVGNPLTAEDIAATLSVARSNVSTSLKELQRWELVTVSHRLGDRRDHFSVGEDTWTMLMTILEARKRREIEPTLAMLQRATDAMKSDDTTPPGVKRRIGEMHTFVATLDTWFDQVKTLDQRTLLRLVKLGTKVANFIGTRRRGDDEPR